MKLENLNFFLDEGYEIDPGILERLKLLCQKVLIEEGSDLPVNIILTGDSEVRELNRDYRNKDKTTDVLSFPWEADPEDEQFLTDEDKLLGELYISLPQVERQAPRFDTTYEEEMQRVTIHGLLHLLGFDHIKTADRKVMRAREEHHLGRSPCQEKE